jgi:hypothetical protein
MYPKITPSRVEQFLVSEVVMVRVSSITLYDGVGEWDEEEDNECGGGIVRLPPVQSAHILE